MIGAIKMKKKRMILIVFIGIMVSGIVLMYSSYALFSANQISKSAITIKVGTMNGALKIDGLPTNQLMIPAKETKTFTITLENLNNIPGKFLLYYTNTLASDIKIGYTTGTGIDIPPKENGVIISKNGKKTYSIKVKNGTTNSQTISLEVLGGLETPSLTLPSNAHVLEEFKGESLVNALLQKTNDKTITEYTKGNVSEMYTFTHEKGTQQTDWTTEELTDYRYIGSTPNNYVYFNCTNLDNTSTCEIWRIIGIFTVEDENGNKEQRMKIMRSEPIGLYSMDAKGVGVGSSTSHHGSNEWSDSYIRQLLNETYYKRTTGTCYHGIDTKSDCDFTQIGLTSTAQNMISEAKYYLGGIAEYGVSLYEQERGNARSANRNISAISKIGLLYPTDYGYTYALGVNDHCFTYVHVCGNKATSAWMYNVLTKNGSNHSWFITPPSTDNYTSLHIQSTGSLVRGSVYNPYYIVPCLYLNSEVEVVAGTGSSNDPYQLA